MTTICGAFRYKTAVNRVFFVVVCAMLLLLAGCAGNGGKTPTVIEISPSNVELTPGAVQYFNALLNGNRYPQLEWSVQGPGSITQDGKYTAPNAAGTAQIIVAAKDRPELTATATVTITEGIVVRISAPRLPLPIVTPHSTLDFDADVSGTTNEAVTWSVTAGEISSGGIFKAPESPGIYTVTATSAEDPTKTAFIDVTVVGAANVRMTIEDLGDVVMHLAIAEAPNTTGNFVSLINKGFYDGIIFHRYEPGFVIQGGDPLTKTLPLDDPSIGTGGPGYTIDFEVNSLLHEKYALAMARSSDRNSAGSQFYITLDPQPSLDGDYVVFGKVISGQDVVDALRRGNKIVRMVVEAVE